MRFTSTTLTVGGAATTSVGSESATMEERTTVSSAVGSTLVTEREEVTVVAG